MSKFTPGPWEWNDPKKFKQVVGKFSDFAVYAPGNVFPWRMAEVVGPDEATAEANARLIAAAPEMLSLLEQFAELECYCVNSAVGASGDGTCPVHEARALLAKVRS